MVDDMIIESPIDLSLHLYVFIFRWLIDVSIMCDP
jgi:hypothetical protein